MSSGGDITLEFSTVDAYADPLGALTFRFSEKKSPKKDIFMRSTPSPVFGIVRKSSFFS